MQIFADMAQRDGILRAQQAGLDGSGCVGPNHFERVYTVNPTQKPQKAFTPTDHSVRVKASLWKSGAVHRSVVRERQPDPEAG